MSFVALLGTMQVGQSHATRFSVADGCTVDTSDVAGTAAAGGGTIGETELVAGF